MWKNNEALLTSIKLYPNPSTNYIEIDIKNTERNNVKVYNVIGQLIIEKKRCFSTESIDISNLIIY